MLVLIAVPFDVAVADRCVSASGLESASDHQSVCRAPGALEEIEIDGDREISVRFTGNATWSRCQWRAKFVHPWIMLVSFQTEGRRWPVRGVIAADAVETEAFRRWRVALKLHTTAA